MLEDLGKNNKIICPKGFILSGKITGSNNTVMIGETRRRSSATVIINGDNNYLSIGENTALSNPHLYLGNHVRKADRVLISIGSAVTTEPGCAFYVYNTDNKLKIGNDCMFSSGITVRCGESPHLIFDVGTGGYLDISEGVFIGDHVWVGERVYITKNVTIPDECIVAALSVVTKRFDKPFSVLAGNPAKVAKEGVKWARNETVLAPDSPEAISLRQYRERNTRAYQSAKLTEFLPEIKQLIAQVDSACDTAETYQLLGTMLQEIGSYEKAIAFLTAGARRFPDDRDIKDLLFDVEAQADAPMKYMFSCDSLRFHIDSPTGAVRRNNPETLLKGWVRRDPQSDLEISYHCHDGSSLQIPITIREDVKEFFENKHGIEVNSNCGFSMALNLSSASHLFITNGSEKHRINIISQSSN